MQRLVPRRQGRQQVAEVEAEPGQRPGKVAQTGLDAGRPLLESISDMMGYWSFFENFI